MRKILLVEPKFPVPPKSRNHKNFLPIGLLKIAAYLRDNGCKIKLVRGTTQVSRETIIIDEFNPDEVWVTSLFTYWAKYVRDAVLHYKDKFPLAIVKVGGIYASLLPQKDIINYTGCDQVHSGVMPEVERYIEKNFPAYDLITNANPHPIDFQIIHASRGCPRKCPFCGTWKIEPKFIPKQSIKNEIKFTKVVFYDNNFLMNPYVEELLGELIELKQEGRIKWVECQSGLDGRILLKKPKLASMMKEAGFRYPRIAWDWGYDQSQNIEEQVNILKMAGYKSRDISVFMIYNYEIHYEEMEKKRITCWEWKVQISDCRYRPLNNLVDDYNPSRESHNLQNYFIHEKWSDSQIKQFRKHVRQQNICVRHRLDFYSSAMEHRRIEKFNKKKINEFETLAEKKAFLKSMGEDCWIPNDKPPIIGKS